LEKLERLGKTKSSRVQDSHPIGKTLDFVNVVGGEKHRPVFLFENFGQTLDQLVTHQGIKTAEGFVKDQQARMVRQLNQEGRLHAA